MLTEDYCEARLHVAVPPGDQCYATFLLKTIAQTLQVYNFHIFFSTIYTLIFETVKYKIEIEYSNLYV